MKLLILDRDGVINQDRLDYVRTPQQFEFLPGVLEAIALLSHHGWSLHVVTNQGGVAKGVVQIEDLIAIHRKMQREVQRFGGQIDSVLFCPHVDQDQCDCRKPKPGMLQQLQQRFGRSTMEDVPMVGDSLRDMQAAVAAGCQPHLVLTGHGEETRHDPQLPAQTVIHPDLLSFARHLIASHDD